MVLTQPHAELVHVIDEIKKKNQLCPVHSRSALQPRQGWCVCGTLKSERCKPLRYYERQLQPVMTPVCLLVDNY